MFTIYTTNNCVFCTSAKKLLNNYNLEYLNIILDTPDKKKEFKEKTGLKTVPQIYVSSTGHHIGGYEELQEYVKL
jgi:glutaredoxin